jgi:hypothetical protein
MGTGLGLLAEDWVFELDHKEVSCDARREVITPRNVNELSCRISRGVTGARPAVEGDALHEMPGHRATVKGRDRGASGDSVKPSATIRTVPTRGPG